MDNLNDITSRTPFQLGEWSVDPDSGHLQGKDVELKLEPKVMKVLVLLAQNPGKVVSREELEARVWAGMVVGYDAVSGSIIKLRKALGDDSHHPRYIETVSKKGYRLIAPLSQVGTEAPMSGNGFATTGSGFAPQLASHVRGKLALAVIGLMAMIMAWQLLDLGPDNPAPSTATKAPSVVVLPFKNLSNDPQQEYFSDGITDDIITDLSQVAALRVVARQSAYHYKNRNISLKEVARDLDVAYIVEGSVQKKGQRIRINIQLTDVERGHHLWAERFDRELVDVFAIQDEITRHIIDAMLVTLSDQENQRMVSRNTNNFEAYDTFLQGQQYSRNRSREGFELSRDAYKRAIEMDPAYARAYGALAVALTFGYRDQWTELSFEEAKERALELANKAIALDQSTPQVYWSLGFVHLFRKEFEAAEAAAKQTITLSPNYADGYGLLAFIANWRGKAVAAERYIKKAIELNPYHTFDYPWNLGLSYYTQGRYSECAESLENALERNETVLYPRLYLAACYGNLGRQDDAEWEIEQVNTQRPGTTISHLANTLPYENKKHLQAILRDLHKAGLAK